MDDARDAEQSPEAQADLALRLLQAEGPRLVEEARELALTEHDFQPVGLILAPGASEAADMAEAIEKATGQDLGGRGFVGLVPRELVLKLLRANAPATLDWLEPEHEGSARRLPLVAVTKDGFRLGAQPYAEG